MQILFDGDVHTDYNQIYVVSGPDSHGDLDTAFSGQVNGLCGGASSGFLYLSTGLHAGHVGFTVEIHEEAPPVDDLWEDVVEVPFRPSSETLHVVESTRSPRPTRIYNGPSPAGPRVAWDAARLSSLNWAAPALAAHERGEKLPAPFDDQMKV